MDGIVALCADPLPRLAVRIAVVLATLAASSFLASCSGSASDGRANSTSSEKPLATGEPEGYNADDVAFAHNMITHDQQGIDMSTLAPDRSANPRVLAFAAGSARSLQEDITTARVLLVQWNENPDMKTGNDGHHSTMRGMADHATIAKLESLHGAEFDSRWLQSMISRHQGAIEMANAEIAAGKNVNALSLAKQIIGVRQAEISQMKEILAV
ncbi:DUF305 domain-containing protein [Mycobacterium paraintracellulare]|uniref:DUF305 domain-containing protein n=1 Tax=Mycobacterium paraintracellulare TaxID=1138383 RepID=UPI001926B750|nr:DUF305 domain-containing protein [Mycobacterium paraintracellulare]BCP14218.1 hypothetical protein MINTM021_11270 [Mycobacterium paraintracellulare]